MKTIFDFKKEYNGLYDCIKIFIRSNQNYKLFYFNNEDFLAISEGKILKGIDYNRFINSFDFYIDERVDEFKKILFLILDSSEDGYRHNVVMNAFTSKKNVNINCVYLEDDLKENEDFYIKKVKRILNNSTLEDYKNAYDEIKTNTGLYDLKKQDLYSYIASKISFDAESLSFRFF